MQVLDDTTGHPYFPSQDSRGPTATSREDVWTIAWPGLPKGPFPFYLRLVFRTELTQIEVATVAPPGAMPLTITMTLADWINATGVRFVGWEGATIESFARIVQNPQQQGILGG